jgi:hypothetical protein
MRKSPHCRSRARDVEFSASVTVHWLMNTSSYTWHQFPVRYPVSDDAALHGDRVIRLRSTNGPVFELLTDAVSWAEVNWLSSVD